MAIMTMQATDHRLNGLDSIRGFALLGILLMNIQSFSMPGATYLNPYAYGDMQGANFVIWLVTHLFADQKFLSLFSMLFGAGVLLFTQRLEQKYSLRQARSLHYRRTFWLLLFGLAHGYLLWYGDILYSYALCGFLVYVLRNLSVRSLVAVALLSLSLSSAINLLTGFAIPYMPADAIAQINQSWQPDQSALLAEIAAYTGNWSDALATRAEATLFLQTYVFLTYFAWRVLGMMLLGMALFKSGFFHGYWSTKHYFRVALLCGLVGLALVVAGVLQNLQHAFSLEYSMFIGSQFNYWGSVLMAICYACILMLLLKGQIGQAFTTLMASTGRLAFSHYLLQTLLCTGLFYGLALFGDVNRVEQLAVVLAIWTLQIATSPVWLRYFHYGPMEWLWRSLTYWQRPPFSRTTNDAPKEARTAKGS